MRNAVASASWRRSELYWLLTFWLPAVLEASAAKCSCESCVIVVCRLLVGMLSENVA